MGDSGKVGRQIQTDDPDVLTAEMRAQRCWLQESGHGGRVMVTWGRVSWG